MSLNWSYFKFEFSGKPDDDVETNLLRMNVMYGSASLFALSYLGCLGVQCHVYYYCL